MTDDTRILPCVLIPLTDRQLLLPSVSIAEVVDHATELETGDTPPWLAGYLDWRGLRLPVVSYEAANGGQTVLPEIGRGRVVVLNTIGPQSSRLPFLALVTQGIPSQTRLEASQVLASAGSEAGPADLMQVGLEGEQAWIPDLEYLEELATRTTDQG